MLKAFFARPRIIAPACAPAIEPDPFWSRGRVLDALRMIVDRRQRHTIEPADAAALIEIIEGRRA